MRRVSPEGWQVIDYSALLNKYYKDDADFFSAIDMDKRAVRYLRIEPSGVSAEIFP
jgi:hypothetical protein